MSEARPRPSSWTRWLAPAMLVTGVVGLAILVFTGSHTKDRAKALTQPDPADTGLVQEAKLALTTVAVQLDHCATRNGGNFEPCTLAVLLAGNEELAAAARESNLILESTPTSYSLTAQAGQNRFTLARNNNGAQTRSCAPAGTSACNAGGSW